MLLVQRCDYPLALRAPATHRFSGRQGSLFGVVSLKAGAYHSKQVQIIAAWHLCQLRQAHVQVADTAC